MQRIYFKPLFLTKWMHAWKTWVHNWQSRWKEITPYFIFNIVKTKISDAAFYRELWSLTQACNTKKLFSNLGDRYHIVYGRFNVYSLELIFPTTGDSLTVLCSVLPKYWRLSPNTCYVIAHMFSSWYSWYPSVGPHFYYLKSLY